MSRIAILSDIHANSQALEAVLDDVENAGVDALAFGGDIVGYGAHPRECVRRVRETGMPCVLGNHDYFVSVLSREKRSWDEVPDAFRNPVWAGVLHAIRALEPADVRWLSGLPMLAQLPEAVLLHASLHEPEAWHYLEDSESVKPTLRLLDELETPVGFFGHTHHQRLFYDGSSPLHPWAGPDGRIRLPEGITCAITVGSVGQPRDLDPRAGWVIWDSDERLLERRRTAYDVEGAAQAIRDAGLPEASARRLLTGDSRVDPESETHAPVDDVEVTGVAERD